MNTGDGLALAALAAGAFLLYRSRDTYAASKAAPVPSQTPIPGTGPGTTGATEHGAGGLLVLPGTDGSQVAIPLDPNVLGGVAERWLELAVPDPSTGGGGGF